MNGQQVSSSLSNSSEQPGLRARIIAPTPPAPVPEARKKAVARTDGDRSSLKSSPTAPTTSKPEPEKHTSDSDVVRSTGSMAIATLLSRITGFLRTVMIGAALSPAIASAFNTANTLPNLITEIVLGAVLTSLVIPVLTRAEKEDPDGGSGFFRRLLTLSVTLLGGVTILSIISAPILTRMMLSSEGQVNVVMSTAFAYWLLPQIFFYGLFALFMAVLNTREIFKPGAWAPVLNNVITLSVLGIYMVLPARLHADQHVGVLDPQILFLGIGTSLGVVAQCLFMVPYLRRAGIDMRPLWGIDDRLKQFGGMAMAIIVYVAISQFGYIITTRIASLADEAAPFIYQQHWMLLQVPYGIIGVTLLTAIMPRLSRNAADGDDRAVVSDIQLGSKLTFIALIPIVIFFTAFGVPIANALFAYGQFDAGTANILGWTLSFSAFTLIPYALVLLHLRVFYAREEVWTPTFIIAGITATKVLLSLLAPVLSSSPERVVILLGAANGFSFITGAVIGAYLLRKKLGLLGMRSLAQTSLWAFGSAVVGAAAAWALGWIIQALIGDFLLGTLGSIGFLIYLGILGVFFLIITGLVLSRSGLPEVQNLGQALTRIPGMSRFIRPNNKISLDVGEVSEQDFSTQLVAPSEFAATPVPPPMSAGIVRGPRLVPGAPVSDGRFRLLADHGGVQGARFWQAREITTGREVALVFVDTSGNAPFAPLSPAAAAGIAYEVQRRTKKLASLNSSAVASNIHTEAYRNGCLIVADWVPGSSLAAVAEAGADPRAAALALADLTETVGLAHDKGIPAGLDNKSRIRINTDGHAILAFPAILPNASTLRDAKSLAWATDMLIDASLAPSDVKAMLTQAQELSEVEEPDYAALAVAMRTCGLLTEEPAPLVVKKEKTPKPAKRDGFGASDYSVKGMATIAAVVIVLVSLVAAGTALLTSFFGGKNQESPLATVETTTSATPEPVGPPLYLALDKAREWDEGAGVDVEDVTDGDTSTAWTSTGGAGLLVDLSTPARLDRIILTTGSGSNSSVTSTLKIYAFQDSSPHSLSEGIEIGTVDYSGRSLSHSIRDSSKIPGSVESVVILVDEVHSSQTSNTDPEMQIAEVELVGW
ncbi:lipid II flippase MurJ [Corynebacterium crudilactis]|uniref:Murein biosynthesis protein MurJ n=1 Tax=Corynebacterium crudilactis TaxID=1652495 RepID=A0A172QWU6_9CORY|nr:lipid II flippase MurJ [Corynebacterium crudilactis]ANE05185.1 murein biosynthesis protein MurJ [Corynebacterium crudilactis]